jgi:moderate conductance mechanosensitive channel
MSPSVSSLLAQDAPPAEEGEESPGLGDLMDPDAASRPIADWLRDNTDLPTWAVELVDVAIEPALRIAVILLLAWAVLWFARRTLRRGIQRAKDPEPTEPGRRRRLRTRMSMDEGRRQYSVRRAQRADALGALANSILGVVVWTIAVFMVLGTFGITLGPLIAGAGILGVAVGFGAQGLVRDFLSGVFMLIEDQYGVGDIVDVGEAAGVVEGVTLRSTRIRDVEGTLWHVPNGEIRRVGNMSQQWARVLLDIGVSYGTDVDEAIEIIEAVAVAMAEEDAYRDLFIDPPEVWGVQALGADSVDIRLVIKVKPAEQWALGRELRRRIKAAFDAAEVEIPFPQRTVWLRTEEPVSIARQRGASDGGDGDEGAPPRDGQAAIQKALDRAAAGDRGREHIEGQDVAVEDANVEEPDDQPDPLAGGDDGAAGPDERG